MWLQVPVKSKKRRKARSAATNMSSKKLPLREATIFKTTYLFSTAFGGNGGAASAALQGDGGMYVHTGSLVTFPSPVSFDTAKGPAK